MAASPTEMHTWAARVATFETPVQRNKRRASAQAKQKKKDGTVEWPHARPCPEKLARAGFFFRPGPDSLDNVQCYFCTVKLDGWEPTDDPTQEHLAHSIDCYWAKAISVARQDDAPSEEIESRDPMGELLVDARRATFAAGQGWPHENKKGWKCKIETMIEAGWCWDPSGEGEDTLDSVTCFYCDLSLDGWEPKDDPFAEHKRRNPDCRFFELLERYHGSAQPVKVKKTKGRAKASTRNSAASKTSRLSTQSTMSEMRAIGDSFADDLGDATMAGADDSIITTATTASQATATGTTKSKKKSTRAKATAKGSKGRKKAVAENEGDVEAPVLETASAESQIRPQSSTNSDQIVEADELASTQTTLPPTRGVRTVRSVEISQTHVDQLHSGPPKKVTRGRKAKAAQHPQVESDLPQTPDHAAILGQRESEVSAQLQDELEHSMDLVLEEAQDQSTPQVVELKRGVKRTSDGVRKQSATQVSTVTVEFAPPPKDLAAPEGKRKRKPKQTSITTDDEYKRASEASIVSEEDPLGLEAVVPKAAPPAQKGKGRPKVKKASSTSMSRSSKATARTEEPEAPKDDPEGLEKDEMEIEQELERIAAEQAESNVAGEFEPSPSDQRHSRSDEDARDMEREVDLKSKTPTKSPLPAARVSPSSTGSDKENQPSSAIRHSAKHEQYRVMLSPTKTTRIALATGSPNRSPGKTSPSKQISGLVSSVPWTMVDLETVLLPSPQPTPGRLAQQLVDAAGALTSPEKKMSVEEWIHSRAERSEEKLRLRCEQMVGTFEREGLRALESLGGLHVLG